MIGCIEPAGCIREILRTDSNRLVKAAAHHVLIRAPDSRMDGEQYDFGRHQVSPGKDGTRVERVGLCARLAVPDLEAAPARLAEAVRLLLHWLGSAGNARPRDGCAARSRRDFGHHREDRQSESSPWQTTKLHDFCIWAELLLPVSKVCLLKRRFDNSKLDRSFKKWIQLVRAQLVLSCQNWEYFLDVAKPN